MFKSSSSSSSSSFDRRNRNFNVPLAEMPLTLSLGDNVFNFTDDQGWIMKSNDLEEAENEIEVLMEERTELLQALEHAREQTFKLKDEMIGSEKTKQVAMDMLAEEHEKRLNIEDQLKGYKTELRKSYKVIIELRKMLNQSHAT